MRRRVIESSAGPTSEVRQRMGGAGALAEAVVVGVQRDVDRVGGHGGVLEHEEALRKGVAGLAAGAPHPPDPAERQIQRLAVEDLARAGRAAPSAAG